MSTITLDYVTCPTCLQPVGMYAATNSKIVCSGPTCGVITEIDPRDDGYKSCRTGSFRDGNRGIVWLAGWDEAKAEEIAEVERAAGSEEYKVARAWESSHLNPASKNGKDWRAAHDAVCDDDTATEVAAFISNPPGPTVRAAGTSGTVMVGGREEVETFSNFLR